jgi:hypothetical protein
MKPANRRSFLERLLSHLQIVDDEVSSLYWDHYVVYKRTVEVITANPRVNRPNWFFDWMFGAHAHSACATIRRLLDEDTRNRPVSLARIVLDVMNHPDLFTREDFVRDYPEFMLRAGFADRDFDIFAGAGNTAVDPGILGGWLTDAKTKCQRIREYTDKRVAHRDRKPPISVPKWDDLDAAIEAIGDLFRNMNLLLTRASRPELTPLPREDWEWVFEEPWIPPPAHTRDGQTGPQT